MSTKKPPLTKRFTTFVRTRKSMRFAALWLAVFLPLVSALFQVVLDKQNYSEIFPSYLLFPLTMHAFTALWVAAIVYFVRWPASYVGKVVTGTLLGTCLIAYDDRLWQASGLIKAFAPVMPSGAGEMAFMSLIFLGLLIGVALAVGRSVERLLKKYPKLEAKNIILGTYIMIGVVFAGQAIGMLSVLPSMIAQSNVTAPALPKPVAPKAITHKPDVYYIVLDRYTNNEQMSKQLQFSNTDFSNFLQDQKFEVNRSAYSHYSFTTASIASTMSAQYTNPLVAAYKNGELHNRTLYHNIIRHAPVAQAFKEAGYKYHMVGSSYGASNSSALADESHAHNNTLEIFGLKKWLHGLEDSAFLQSPYRRFANLSIPGWPFRLNTHDRDHAGYVRDQLNALDRLASAEEQGGRFIFAHILVPHNPYIFNADGTVRPDTDVESDMPVKEKYVHQVQFINSQMKELVSLIKEKSDGKAAILFNADEGEYPMYFDTTFKQPKNVGVVEAEGAVRKDMRTWSDDWLKMKFGILQAAYVPGVATEDMAHLSSVNLFRVVLNTYAGYKLNYLPSCHFALTTGAQREFKYADITKRFYGAANPACRQYESQ